MPGYILSTWQQRGVFCTLRALVRFGGAGRVVIFPTEFFLQSCRFQPVHGESSDWLISCKLPRLLANVKKLFARIDIQPKTMTEKVNNQVS